MGACRGPSPFIATATQFVPIVREAGSPVQHESLLRPVAELGSTGTLALAEDGRWDVTAVAAVARPDGDGWVLQGRKSHVLDGATADEIAVVARLEGTRGHDGLGVFVVPGSMAVAESVDVIDPTQPIAHVRFDNVAVPAGRVLIRPGDPGAARAIGRASRRPPLRSPWVSAARAGPSSR